MSSYMLRLFSFTSASCSHVTHQLPVYQVAVSISCFEKANSLPTNIVKTGALLFFGWIIGLRQSSGMSPYMLLLLSMSLFHLYRPAALMSLTNFLFTKSPFQFLASRRPTHHQQILWRLAHCYFWLDGRFEAVIWYVIISASSSLFHLHWPAALMPLTNFLFTKSLFQFLALRRQTGHQQILRRLAHCYFWLDGRFEAVIWYVFSV